MPSWTLEQARQHLKAWTDADLALATGKEYSIGSKRLTRANSAEVAERIAFWSREIQRLNGRFKRSRRVIPID